MKGAEQAHPHTEVHCKPGSNLEIVLKIRFHNLISLPVSPLCAVLLETRDGVEDSARGSRLAVVIKKVGERIASAILRLHITKRQQSLRFARRCANRPVRLISLVDDPLCAKLQIVATNDFCDIVRETVRGIAMLPGHVRGVSIESDATIFRVISRYGYTRKFRNPIRTGVVIEEDRSYRALRDLLYESGPHGASSDAGRCRFTF